MSSCSCADRHRSRTAHASLVSEITGLLAGKGPKPGKPEPLLEPLSDSELRVLRYLPTNLTAPEIASEVYLSASTVRTHIHHVYAKLVALGCTAEPKPSSGPVPSAS